MKKILLIPDSFKGTMSSEEVCEIMEKSTLNVFPNAKVVSIPVADGGEGTVDAFLKAVGGTKKYVTVENPFFEKIKTYYGILDVLGKKENAFSEGKTAVIEMASCAGLPLAEGRLNPLITTTYGVGKIIEDVAKSGCNKIILGLGGSATNDGGCGVAAALGVQFFDFAGKEFIPTGGTLKNIARIDFTKLNPILQNLDITIMCDIDNPLYGENGAAYIFAPQKGADASCVVELDNGLRYLADIVKTQTGKDFAFLPGAGAAGGMGFGMLSFLNAKLQMGIETVLNTVYFDDELSDANLVFTGEGKLDSQSLRGKVVVGVARRAKKQAVPVVAVVGDAYETEKALYDIGVSAVFSINRRPLPFSESRKNSKTNLEYTMKDILRLIKVSRLVDV